VSAASITAIGNQAQRSATLLNDVNESEDEEVDIEGDDEEEGVDIEEHEEDEEWDEEEDEEEGLDGGDDNNEDKEEVELENEEEDSEGYTSKIRSMATANLLDSKHTVEAINISIKKSNRNTRIKSILYRKAHSTLLQESMDPISIELVKLSLSQILNYVNPYLSNIYQDILPTEEVQEINQTRKQKKDDLFFDDDTNSLFDEVLDRLMPHSISDNKDNLRSLIDELKYQVLL
jgi:hypothetical protein